MLNPNQDESPEVRRPKLYTSWKLSAVGSTFGAGRGVKGPARTEVAPAGTTVFTGTLFGVSAVYKPDTVMVMPVASGGIQTKSKKKGSPTYGATRLAGKRTEVSIGFSQMVKPVAIAFLVAEQVDPPEGGLGLQRVQPVATVQGTPRPPMLIDVEETADGVVTANSKSKLVPANVCVLCV